MKQIKEQQVWDYLDGTLPPGEQEMMRRLIAEDPEYAALFKEFSALNDTLNGMEADEPSMSFTRHVMEQVSLAPAPGTVRSLVDKRIIYGIAAFFMLTMAGGLAYVLLNVNWSQGTPASPGTGTLSSVKLSLPQNPVYLQGFALLEVIMGLYFIDTLLRKRAVKQPD
ncbi:anti-sigma factor family protein [Hufsiella ginkgonis]|uniref:Uncharacterized protein n=1 Tax=Hufsiella ginkgonis TaxID=2695274 RepID=A0A7K1XVL9_9SPHI|nr:hypothetical protein [Hufsiella ginkgonis]MXV14857.1 hypothetical protein [Hufsiella ginkgonis]